MHCPLPISVIIPTLNSASTLERILRQLNGSVECLIVVDGGSNDSTLEIATRHEATLIFSAASRGHQLRVGGGVAKSEWLLFLHADTLMDDGWEVGIYEFLRGCDREDCGVFAFALDDVSPHARRVERLANWRSCKFGLPYGDQGLLISREFYTTIGGFRSLPLMEDVDIIRRIGKSRLKNVAVRAVTSPIRYQNTGWWLRPALNLFLLGLYFLGLSPHFIAKLYK